METIPITFSKRHLKTFLTRLSDLIEPEYLKPDQEEIPSWKSIWTTWKEKGFIQATSRRKISLVMFDTFDTKMQAAKLMATIIKDLNNTFPIVHANITFTKSPDDPEKWQAIFQQDDTSEEIVTNETTESTDETKIDDTNVNKNQIDDESTWTNVSNKTKFNKDPTVMNYKNTLLKELKDTHTTVTNKFALLDDNSDEDIINELIDEQENTTDDDDKLLSYDEEPDIPHVNTLTKLKNRPKREK